MITKRMEIKIPTGLDPSTIAMFIQTASQYDSRVYIEVENKKVNAKSIMGMMTLGLAAGEEITVSAAGDDEQQAIDANKITRVKRRHLGKEKENLRRATCSPQVWCERWDLNPHVIDTRTSNVPVCLFQHSRSTNDIIAVFREDVNGFFHLFWKAADSGYFR